MVSAIAVASNRSMTQNPYFSKGESEQIRADWNKPGRFALTAPASAEKAGRSQMRLTVEGSTWLWNYYRARGFGKVIPTQDPKSQDPEAATWDAWIDAKVNFDRAVAQLEADQANGRPTTTMLPPDPGLPPDSLVALAGEPPIFASCVRPTGYKITFSTGVTLSYEDNVSMRPKFAYYRFSQGVRSGGVSVKKMPESDLQALFRSAGLDDRAKRIMASVSLLEGGFDSVNTYDTGFLSVGVIQFATLKEGAGSLGDVLLDLKKDNPTSFQRDFRQYGIDVAPAGYIVALDLNTGEEKIGAAAVATIIEDKRLTAVFQHAGLTSRDFCISQIDIAMKRYFPAGDPFSVTLDDGTVVSGTVGDFVKSEAGLATLMDRKVNTGKVDPLAQTVKQLMTEYGLRTLGELATYEYQLVQRIRYRKDYLGDLSLSQPREVPPPAFRGGTGKRGGTRP